MSVGLLVITHNRLGEDLLSTTLALVGPSPIKAQHLSVRLDVDPERVAARPGALVTSPAQGHGVMVLTAMYGSTPSNIASRLSSTGRVMVVAGVNLPMLVRVMNYHQLPLPELAQKALSGGSAGVMLCPTQET